MLSYILRRLLTLIPLILAVTLLASVLMYISPGDVLTKLRAQPDVPQEVVQRLEQQYSLVDSEGEPTRWYVRYASWLGNLMHGNLGESITYRIPVLTLIMQRLPATLILSMTSIAFAWMVAIPLGVLAAIYKDSIWDRLSALLAYAALSIPEFFLAILAVYFAAVTGWFPVGGRSAIGSEFYPMGMQLADYAYHLMLPTLVLGVGSVASMMRVMRANFIDFMRQEFATTARAKGLSEKVVMFKHVLRNAINPLITSLGFAFSSLLSGALLVENVMNYPGLGQLIFQSLLEEDEYVVMAALMISVIMLVLGNLLADMFLAWSDPRVRLSEAGSRSKSFSPLRLAVLSAVVIGVVMLEIAIEAFAPGAIPALLGVLKWVAIIIGGLIVICCLAMVAYIAFQLFKRLGGSLLRRPLGLTAAIILFVLYFGAAFAGFLAPYSVSKNNLSQSFHPPTAIFWDGGFRVQAYENVDRAVSRYEPVEGKSYPLEFFVEAEEPSKVLGFIPVSVKCFGVQSDDPTVRVYLLGSDNMGRDVFSRLLYGSQISLTIGLIGISITLTLGFIVGGLAGYFGGSVDFIGMRVVEFLLSIPGLYLLLALRSALFQPGFSSGQVYLAIIIILSIIGWAGAARVIRGMTLSVSSRQYVMAAESMGQPAWKILYKHILPNLASYLLVAATLSIPGYILGEAALSFLGLGIQEPSASWGLMLKQSQSDMKVLFLNFWWLLTPGFMIFVTVVSYNVLGDVLRDIVDPKMKTQ
ncbi:ABC transporter permease subunit [Cerasicoccus maritimus]|uniref:ABC transporter permease subunit n=1 Tax=Cerasicoccus maritimus TaxID=490089 RepID=UPI0028529772|nr:ABC transporter permease subunit [Cerasicoccus maritimus]